MKLYSMTVKYDSLTEYYDQKMKLEKLGLTATNSDETNFIIQWEVTSDFTGYVDLIVSEPHNPEMVPTDHRIIRESIVSEMLDNVIKSKSTNSTISVENWGPPEFVEKSIKLWAKTCEGKTKEECREMWLIIDDDWMVEVNENERRI